MFFLCIQLVGADDDGDDKVQCKKEKIVTATKKGAAVLDQYIPDNIKTAYHVLQVGDEIYDATMNQTNVGGNNNKFYIIQALGLSNNSLTLSLSLTCLNYKTYSCFYQLSDMNLTHEVIFDNCHFF
jgi:hypothetical protein